MYYHLYLNLLCIIIYIILLKLEIRSEYISSPFFLSQEALEMLRTVGQEVTLEICRPPPGTMGDDEDLPDGGNTLGVVSTSLTTPNTSHNYLSPSPSFSSCGVRNLISWKIPM